MMLLIIGLLKKIVDMQICLMRILLVGGVYPKVQNFCLEHLEFISLMNPLRFIHGVQVRILRMLVAWAAGLEGMISHKIVEITAVHQAKSVWSTSNSAHSDANLFNSSPCHLKATILADARPAVGVKSAG
jgi:hypothetical protein